MSNEHYTPGWVVDLARWTMGGIDLDPASCALAQRWSVGAERFYTAEANGLMLPWRGRIWLNPPYSVPLCGQFIDKLDREIACHHVQQAVVLVNSSTAASWYHQLIDICDSACLFDFRLGFIDEDGILREQNRYDQTAFYFGTATLDFAEAFQPFGYVTPLFSRQ